MNNWQTVFTTTQLYKADIVKDILANSGIPAVVVNKQDNAYKFGNIEVSVIQNSVLLAIKIIGDIKWNDE